MFVCVCRCSPGRPRGAVQRCAVSDGQRGAAHLTPRLFAFRPAFVTAVSVLTLPCVQAAQLMATCKHCYHTLNTAALWTHLSLSDMCVSLPLGCLRLAAWRCVALLYCCTCMSSPPCVRPSGRTKDLWVTHSLCPGCICRRRHATQSRRRCPRLRQGPGRLRRLRCGLRLPSGCAWRATTSARRGSGTW